MADLTQILSDPNYVNANAATKKAIFDKYSTLDSNYTSANEATKSAIRSKFGVEVAAEPETPKGISPEFQKQSALSSYRGEHPILATVGDIATGMGGSVRGIANLSEKGYNKLTGKSDETPTPLGEKIWPKLPGSEGTGGKLVGSLIDPIPWIVGGEIANVAPYVKIGGKGLMQGLKATGRNALSSGTTGMAIGALSDEGDATSGGIAGAVIGGVIPGLGAATAGLGKWAGKALAPAFESGRTKLARDFFQANIGPARDKIIRALMNPSQIIAGSPTTAADRIAAATVGQTDKFGSAIVAAQDQLARQSAQGISDTAKTIAAQQEAARAAELAKVSGTKGALETAVAARKAASEANYAKAFGNKVPVDSELLSMTDNPYFASAIDDTMALVKAKEQQISKDILSGKLPVGTPKSLDLTEQLHLLKLSLDKHLGRTGDTALSATEKREYKKIQDQVVSWLKNQNPDYEAARAAHEAASGPINQMKLGQDLERALQAPLSGAERPGVFANAVRTAENKVSKATGRARAEDLTLEQRASIQRVQDELARNAERNALSSEVNVKNLFDIAEKGKGSIQIPNLLSRPAMVTNWFLRHSGNSADDLIAQDAGKLLLSDPAGFAQKYLADVPPKQQGIVMSMLTRTLNSARNQAGQKGPYIRASITSATQNGD